MLKTAMELPYRVIVKDGIWHRVANPNYWAKPLPLPFGTPPPLANTIYTYSDRCYPYVKKKYEATPKT